MASAARSPTSSSASSARSSPGSSREGCSPVSATKTSTSPASRGRCSGPARWCSAGTRSRAGRHDRHGYLDATGSARPDDHHPEADRKRLRLVGGVAALARVPAFSDRDPARGHAASRGGVDGAKADRPRRERDRHRGRRPRAAGAVRGVRAAAADRADDPPVPGRSRFPRPHPEPDPGALSRRPGRDRRALRVVRLAQDDHAVRAIVRLGPERRVGTGDGRRRLRADAVSAPRRQEPLRLAARLRAAHLSRKGGHHDGRGLRRRPRVRERPAARGGAVRDLRGRPADDPRRSRGGAAGRDRGRLRRHPGAGHPARHRARRLAGARGLARHGGGRGDRVPRAITWWRRTSSCRASTATSSRCRRCRCCSRCSSGAGCRGSSARVLVLPLVAAYPIIERHWLGGFLRSRVLTDHKALAKAAESGSDVAMDAVISGEKHASEGFARTGLHRSLDVDDPDVRQKT